MKILKSEKNTKIKNIINLTKNKKYRNSQKLFVIEGIKILTEAVKNKITISQIFVTQKFLTNNLKNNLDIFKFINNYNIPVNIITENIAKKISDNISPQELFAVCNIKQPILLESIFEKNKSQNFVMLLNLQDPGNFGTIIRTCLALGINNILVSTDCPDIYSFKVLRATMGTVFGANIIQINNDMKTIQKTIQFLKNNNFKIFASAICEKSEDIKNICFENFNKKVLVIGNEGNGLSPDIIELCDKSIKIPMQFGVDSLNVAVATGILIWKLKSN